MENNLIHLTIDGVAVEAVPGSTILQAASAAGINIPTLCYMKEINAIGRPIRTNSKNVNPS